MENNQRKNQPQQQNVNADRAQNLDPKKGNPALQEAGNTKGQSHDNRERDNNTNRQTVQNPQTGAPGNKNNTNAGMDQRDDQDVSELNTNRESDTSRRELDDTEHDHDYKNPVGGQQTPEQGRTDQQQSGQQGTDQPEIDQNRGRNQDGKNL